MFKEASSKFARFLIWFFISLIILSFAMWGIGDVFRGSYDGSVARVGGSKISDEEFAIALKQERNSIRQYMGGNVTDEQLKTMKIENAVINNLVNQKILTLEMQGLGLFVDEKTVATLISQNTMFTGEDGNFSKEMFLGFLRNSGKNEKEYIQYVKDQAALSLIVDAVMGVEVIPQGLFETLYKFRAEKRVAKYISVPSRIVKEIPESSETALNEYYEKNKQTFAAPETRDVSYIVVDIETAAKNFKISEQDVKAEYESRKKDFKPQEARDVYNLLVEDEAKANKISESLEKGEDFLKVVSEQAGKSKGDIFIEDLFEGDLPKDVSKQVMLLKEEQYTKPIKSSFGWHIIKLLSIKKTSFPDYEAMKKDLKQELEEKGSNNYIFKLINDIEDELASGTSMEETAEKMKLKFARINGIVNGEKSGDDKLVNSDIFMKAAFSTELKKQSQPIPSADQKQAFIVNVDAVTPARIRAFDEVKGIVIDKWKKERTDEMQRKIAFDIAERIKQHKTTINGEAEQLGVPLKVSSELKRGGQNGDLPQAIIENIFLLKEGQASDAFKAKDGEYIIAVLEKIVAADEGGKESAINQIKEQVKNSYINDIMSGYLQYLRTKYPVQINESKLSKF